MPQFAANLSMLYPELDFLDRFEAAARDGFKAVEFLFPYAHRAARARGAAEGPRLAAGAVQHARRATGTRASGAWPACPGAKPNSAMASARRWRTRKRWLARVSM